MEIFEIIGLVYRLTATLRYRLRSPNPFSEFFDRLSKPYCHTLDRLQTPIEILSQAKTVNQRWMCSLICSVR